MGDCFFSTESGLGADLEFLKFGFGFRFRTQKGADNCGEEADGDAQDSRVVEREKRLHLDEVPFCGDNVRCIDAHNAGAHENQDDAREEADSETGDGPGCAETLPEDGQDDHWEVCAGGDCESEADKKGNIDRL